MSRALSHDHESDRPRLTLIVRYVIIVLATVIFVINGSRQWTDRDYSAPRSPGCFGIRRKAERLNRRFGAFRPIWSAGYI
jgi:hypothetical protein